MVEAIFENQHNPKAHQFNNWVSETSFRAGKLVRGAGIHSLEAVSMQGGL